MFLVHWLSIMALHWFHDDPCWNICTLSNVQLKLSCRKIKILKELFDPLGRTVIFAFRIKMQKTLRK